MRVPKIKQTEATTIAVVPMTDVKLQWTSEGVRRDGLPEGNSSTQFGVWMHGALLCLTPVHGIAVDIALLRAGDQHHVTDLTTDTTLLAGHDEWIPWPNEPKS